MTENHFVKEIEGSGGQQFELVYKGILRFLGSIEELRTISKELKIEKEFEDLILKV
jgi:hypothetical protein